MGPRAQMGLYVRYMNGALNPVVANAIAAFTIRFLHLERAEEEAWLGLGEKAVAEELEAASGWERASMYSGVEIWRKY